MSSSSENPHSNPPSGDGPQDGTPSNGGGTSGSGASNGELPTQNQHLPPYAGPAYAAPSYGGPPYGGPPYGGPPYGGSSLGRPASYGGSPNGQPYPGPGSYGPAYGPYVGYGPGFPAPPPTSGFAIASLVLGILSIVFCWALGAGIILGVLALIFGMLGMKRVRQAASGRGLAVGGISTGAVGLVVTAVILAFQIIAITSPVTCNSSDLTLQQQINCADHSTPNGTNSGSAGNGGVNGGSVAYR